MACRLARGAVVNFHKYYPDIKVILADDGTLDESGHEVYNSAYNRDAHNAKERKDLDVEKLKNLPNTQLLLFKNHMGHGFTLDRVLPHVKTDLMLTMDSDIRITEEGSIEQYLEEFNKDSENIYSVGATIGDFFCDNNGKINYSWISPSFALWNMEPLRRYARLSFSNFIYSVAGGHWGTGACLCKQLETSEIHRPRKPYKAVHIANEVEQVPHVYHMRKFSNDSSEEERYKKWEELIDG